MKIEVIKLLENNKYDILETYNVQILPKMRQLVEMLLDKYEDIADKEGITVLVDGCNFTHLRRFYLPRRINDRNEDNRMPKWIEDKYE